MRTINGTRNNYINFQQIQLFSLFKSEMNGKYGGIYSILAVYAKHADKKQYMLIGFY
jgi:hypothetical protein